MWYRPGFTLIELLVVIAIVGVLVALVLPAI
jgi:prepilin-type N-terminal cleavage/methylation domain-containing protein